MFKKFKIYSCSICSSIISPGSTRFLMTLIIVVASSCVKFEAEQPPLSSSNGTTSNEIPSSNIYNNTKHRSLYFSTPAGVLDTSEYFKLDISNIHQLANEIESLRLYGSSERNSIKLNGSEITSANELSLLSSRQDSTFVVEIIFKNGSKKVVNFHNKNYGVLSI